MDSPTKLFLDAASLVPVSHYFLAFSLLPLTFLYNSLDLHLPRYLFAGFSVPDTTADSPYLLLLKAASLIPPSHYYFALSFIVLVYLYNFFEIHILHDLLTGFRGDSVRLTFHPRTELYDSVISKCRVLHGRYLSTPWLSSPHLQTAFQGIFGRPPAFSYKRELFQTPDGGTIALDWLRHSDVRDSVSHANGTIIRDDKSTPLVVVVPGVASDSSCAYVKHIAFNIAKRGWNVCVSNHRGFGGVPITSDRLGNGGHTEDTRMVIDHIHSRFPETPLYAAGMSIGANLLIKYLGEEGLNVPVLGAAAIGCPWDLLVCDRFLHRRFMQKFYDIAIAVALKSHAQKFKPIFSRLAGDWEGIEKSRSLRDFDCYVTCPIGNITTTDTYYRHSSCVNVVGNVAVPLLCINALDDPVCTVEAIPWDECRANKNVVLATTRHGGHVAYYEGVTANSMWWVRAAEEFLDVLHSSKFSNRKKEMPIHPLPGSLEFSANEPAVHSKENEKIISDTEKRD